MGGCRDSCGAAGLLDPDTVHKWGHVLRGVKDSKQLKPERREALAAELNAARPDSAADLSICCIGGVNSSKSETRSTIARTSSAVSGLRPVPSRLTM